MKKTFLLLLLLAFLPVKTDLFGIGIRFFDLLGLVAFFGVFFRESNLLEKSSVPVLIALSSLGAVLSMIGLLFFNPLTTNLGFHINNILFGAARYIQIIFIYYYAWSIISYFGPEKVLKYTALGIFLSISYALFQYFFIFSPFNFTALEFVGSGAFIHHARLDTLAGSVNGGSWIAVVGFSFFILLRRIGVMSNLISLIAIVLALLAIFLTGSKTGVVGLIIFYFAWFYWRREINAFSLIFTLVFVCTIYILLPDAYLHRLEGIFYYDKTVDERVVRGLIGLYILFESPLFGFGHSSVYTDLFSMYAAGEHRLWIREVGAHNSYISILVRGGLLLSLPLFFLIGQTAFKSIRHLSRFRLDSNASVVAIPLLVGTVLLATDDHFFVPVVFFQYFWFLILFFQLKKSALNNTQLSYHAA